MRTLRVWGTMCGLVISWGSASLGQPASEVADSTDRATEGHVSPSDGGLGSTMTYEQLVRQKAEELGNGPTVASKTGWRTFACASISILAPAARTAARLRAASFLSCRDDVA